MTETEEKTAKPAAGPAIAPPAIDLEVVQGLHHGAAQTLDARPVVVGSGSDADLRLLDEGVRPRHARLRLAGNFLFSRVTLSALEGEVRLADGKAVAAGESLSLSPPQQITLGAAAIALSSPGQASRRLTAVAGPAALLLALGLALVYVLDGGPSSPALTAQSLGRLAAEPGPASRPGADVPDLAKRLHGEGLDGDVSLTKTPDGAVLAEGRLSAGDMARWRDVLAWYDSLEAAPVLRNEVVEGEAAAELPRLASVWLGAEPQVVLSDGRQARKGDSAGDGWEIVDIDTRGVRLRRGQRTVFLEF